MNKLMIDVPKNNKPHLSIIEIYKKNFTSYYWLKYLFKFDCTLKPLCIFQIVLFKSIEINYTS